MCSYVFVFGLFVVPRSTGRESHFIYVGCCVLVLFSQYGPSSSVLILILKIGVLVLAAAPTLAMTLGSACSNIC